MKQKDLKKRATKVLTELGAAIRGEKVTAQYRTMHRPIVLAGTSTHQIQQVALEGSVFCIIDRPLNYIRDVSSS
jgi:hypothetical protein